MAIDPDLDADDQDQAETFDETNLTEDGEDIARPDVMRNVYDVTSAEDDAEDDEFEEDAEDFDPDDLDESERESLLEEDDGIDDDEGPATLDQSEVVAVDDDQPADFEGESEPMMSEDEDTADSGRDIRRERRRDRELEDTFPASDAPPTNPGAD